MDLILLEDFHCRMDFCAEQTAWISFIADVMLHFSCASQVTDKSLWMFSL